jgi:fructose-1-phosphate kinase PfkB-like protein
MILTVTPNVALDITYRVDQLTPGLSHRVRSVEERAGGKGVNVARALHALGHDTFVLGLVGGATAGAITTDLARGGLGQELVVVEPAAKVHRGGRRPQPGGDAVQRAGSSRCRHELE